MKQHLLKVLSNVQVSARYWHMTLDTSRVQETIKPGQFFHVRCSDEYTPFLRRPFSIYLINKEERTIEFLYLVKGEGTAALTKKESGDTVDLFGPAGKGFQIPEHAKEILLLARGVGIATLAALAQEASFQGVHCTAVLSARSKDDLLAADMLKAFGTKVYPVTEEEQTSDVESVERLMHQKMKEKKIDAIYTCGSKRLSKLAQRFADHYNLPGEIALEEHMGCAMGACFACVCDIEEDDGSHKSVRVCIDGPVFPLKKVVLS
ncbi:dihydroorotate dehydrogenase electron transfer subunit [Alteribacillus sp. HJP-4]|uniref:dihydroorotate dehydrogenase electron transfer subunit n=1 Tax=Alteribacillus sp. HJP-4 TaxID=2775394 RepID=UPI0035CCF903